MVSFIQQSLELRISNQWFLLFNSHQNKGYQINGLFYLTVTRTKDIKTMFFFYSAVTRTKDINTMLSFIQG